MKIGSNDVEALHLGAKQAYGAFLGTSRVFGFQPETARILDAFTTPADRSRQELIDSTIIDLKSSGILAKLDLLYMLAAQDEQAARINWASPGSYTLTAVDSPQFDLDEGFTGDGTSAYLDSGIDLTAPGHRFGQNDAHALVYMRTQKPAEVPQAMGQESAAVFHLNPWVNSSDARGNLRGVSSSALTNVFRPDGLGMYGFSRLSSSQITTYSKGTKVADESSASSSITSPSVFLFRAATNRGRGQMSFASIGAGLTEQENAELNSIVEGYMTAIGAL